MTDKINILVAEDEKDLVDIYVYNLEKEGYNVSVAYDGKKAFQMAMDMKPHLIILDVMMPEYDGIEVCYELRKYRELKDTYILLITAINDVEKQVEGLEKGADDYIVKPVNMEVLKSKIKSFLRRETKLQTKQILSYGDMTIDPNGYTATIKESIYYLTKKEFFILHCVASKPRKVFTRQDIIDEVWGKDVYVGNRTIDVHIRRVREKIVANCIKSVKGIGYQFAYSS